MTTRKQDRAEFEAFVEIRGQSITRRDDGYADIQTSYDWDLWQASNSQDAERIANMTAQYDEVAAASKCRAERIAELEKDNLYYRCELELEQRATASALNQYEVCKAHLAEAREQYAMARAFPFLKNETPTEGAVVKESLTGEKGGERRTHDDTAAMLIRVSKKDTRERW